MAAISSNGRLFNISWKTLWMKICRIPSNEYVDELRFTCTSDFIATYQSLYGFTRILSEAFCAHVLISVYIQKHTLNYTS